MDLLGSILGSMEKPPTMGEAERKKAKAQREMIERQQEKEKRKLEEFRQKVQKQIHEFIKDGSQQKLKLEPMEKTYRAIVHEVTDIANLTSFSFGVEGEDRYIMIWKKEFAPSDEELLAYRRDEEWDPEKAKQIAQMRAQQLADAETVRCPAKVQPASNYKDKYKHLIGDTAAKDAAQSTVTNRSYGFVSSENKRDQRTIEQVLADTRARKKQKTSHDTTSPDCHRNVENSVPDSDKTVTQSVRSEVQCERTVVQSETGNTGSNVPLNGS